MPASITTETSDNNGLSGGDFPVRGAAVTIAAGADLPKGAVLGRVTANGKYKLSAAAAVDGSQVPSAILGDAAAAGSGDVSAVAFFAGDFRADALTFGAGHTAATVETALRLAQAPVFIKTLSPL